MGQTLPNLMSLILKDLIDDALEMAAKKSQRNSANEAGKLLKTQGVKKSGLGLSMMLLKGNEISLALHDVDEKKEGYDRTVGGG